MGTLFLNQLSRIRMQIKDLYRADQWYQPDGARLNRVKWSI